MPENFRILAKKTGILSKNRAFEPQNIEKSMQTEHIWQIKNRYL